MTAGEPRRVTSDSAHRDSVLVAPDWLEARLDRPDVVVLDATVWLPPPAHDGDFRAVSGRPGWAERHIRGSQHADLVTTLSTPDAAYHFARLDPADLAARIATFGVNTGDTVVTYDRDDGIWAARLWWMLREIGEDARVLDGGWQSWLAANGSVSTFVAGQYESRPYGNLPARTRGSPPAGWSWSPNRTDTRPEWGGSRCAATTPVLGHRVP